MIGVKVNRLHRGVRVRHFTLVETLVAFGVLSLVAIGIYSCVLAADRMMLTARLHQAAHNIAMDRMWSAFNRDYEAVLEQTTPTVETVPPESVLFDWGGTVRTAVYVMPGYCTIEVRVDWQSTSTRRPDQQTHVAVSVDRYPTLR